MAVTRPTHVRAAFSCMAFVHRVPFAAFSVEFSPFHDHALAVATSQHYGLVGNGALHLLTLDERGLFERRVFETPQGIHDCTWSESNEHQVVTVGANGCVRLWDGTAPDGLAVAGFQGHSPTEDVVAADWNGTRKDSFVTAGWDRAAHVWSPLRSAPLWSFLEHPHNVYCAQWSPHAVNTFATSCGDGCVRLFDTSSRKPTAVFAAHVGEALCLDWNKYSPSQLVTGGLDRSLRLWDCRKLDAPLLVMKGHTMGVKRVKCSPHSQYIFASSSYDMNVMVWDTSIEDAVVQCARHHTEFAVGVDFRLFRPGVLASCGWDGAVWVWDYTRGPPTVGPSPRSPVPGPATGAGGGGGGSAGAGGGAGVAPGLLPSAFRT